jgi:hypothetical protein
MIWSHARAVARLRLVVAFLGEREQAAWWQSNFLSRNARAFMEPVFGNGYHAVTPWMNARAHAR